MIQPLRTELTAAAHEHRLLDIVAAVIPAVQSVNPDQAVIIRLILELTLAVDCPADEPAGILRCHDSAGYYLSGERISVADLLDGLQNLLVRRIHRPGLPAGLLNVPEEYVRMTEGVILSRQLLPQLHRRTLSVLDLNLRRMRLIAVGRTVALRTVCHKDQIILSQINGLILSVLCVLQFDSLFSRRLAVADNIRHLCIVPDHRAGILDILHDRKDHRLILIVSCEAQRTQIRESVDVMDIALHVLLHLESTVPFFKREHGLPVDPEVCPVKIIIKHIVDGLVRQLLIAGKHQLQKLLLRILVQVILPIRVSILSLLLRYTAEGIVRIVLVQLVIL